MFKVKKEVMEPKKTRQVRLWFQKLAPSSSANRTPPTGDPKAAATPAAAPPDTKSRFYLSCLKNCREWVSMFSDVDLPCDIPA